MDEKNPGTGLGAAEFEAHRPHLRAVAHRMLGSLAEADDAVQETWLRASAADVRKMVNVGRDAGTAARLGRRGQCAGEQIAPLTYRAITASSARTSCAAHFPPDSRPRDCPW
ncbi:hypothetical protein C1N81_12455 [Streptomyces sp. SGAir0957]